MMEKPRETNGGQGDPDATLTIWIGLIGALTTFLIIVSLQAVYYHVENSQRIEKVYSRPPEELGLLRAKQEQVLHSYRWIDEKKGVAGIPIERAMELTVRDLRSSSTLAAAAGGGKS